ncbi:MAG: hypothetical protein ACRDHY_03340 [Anaerolineales bacterium]
MRLRRLATPLLQRKRRITAELIQPQDAPTRGREDDPLPRAVFPPPPPAALYQRRRLYTEGRPEPPPRGRRPLPAWLLHRPSLAHRLQRRSQRVSVVTFPTVITATTVLLYDASPVSAATVLLWDALQGAAVVSATAFLYDALAAVLSASILPYDAPAPTPAWVNPLVRRSKVS